MGAVQMNKTTIVTSLIIGGMTPLAQADTLNVPGEYPTILAAVAAALDGDTIAVNPGTYVETIDFNGQDISLVGLAGPDFTTIRAPRLNDTHVLKVQLGESITLQGFTVTGAQRGLYVTSGGGGGNVNVSDCRFNENTMHGLQLHGTGTFVDCTFDNNAADGVNGSPGGTSPFSFESCSFRNNGDRGLDLNAFHLQLTNCVIVGNFQTGLFTFGNASPTYMPFVRNTLIADNGQHGIRIVGSSNMELTNLTVANNGANGLTMGTGTTIRNCIVWNSGTTEINADPLNTDIGYSLVEGGFSGAAFGFVGDPLFVGGGDYRLQAGSPCIDSGLNSAATGLVVDVFGDPRLVNAATPDCPQPGADCGKAPVIDMGAAEHQPGPCPDLDGDNMVGITDFLALLAAWGPNRGHPADYDGDGFVGISDFLLLLASWGDCP